MPPSVRMSDNLLAPIICLHPISEAETKDDTQTLAATDRVARRRIVRNLMAVEIRCAEEAVGAQLKARPPRKVQQRRGGILCWSAPGSLVDAA